MSTAATPLEDPRLTSKKYILKTDDDKVSLSTVTGRNVDLDVIDKYTWGILQVDVPTALQCPPQYTDELVSEVYMDMDNPISNMSMESGEIHSENNDILRITPVAHVVTENFFKDYQHEENTGDHVREDIVEVRVDLTEDTEATKLRARKYKIPKIRKPDKDPAVQTVAIEATDPLGLLLKDFHATNEKDEIVSDKVKSCELKDSKPRDNVEKPRVPDSKNVRPRSAKNAHQFEHPRKLSSRELVEGDLELSDDDCLENQKQNTKGGTSNKLLHHIKTQNLVQAKKDKSEYPKTEKQQQNKEKEESSSKHEEQNVTVKDDSGKHKVDSISNIVSNKLEETHKEPTKEVIKKSRTKKKQNIKGETCKVKPVETKQVVQLEKKKTRSKTSKESKPQDKKAKFSDLFGDSSSLITPEDLGVVPYQPSACTEIVNKYLPIFEDAQDAIDVKEIAQVQTRSKLKDEIKIHETKVEDTEDKSKTKTNNAKPIEGKKCKSKKEDILQSVSLKEGKNNVQTVPPVQATVVNIYENLYPEAPTKEPDVVATVIVSSGVQPQCAGIPVELTTQEQIKHVDIPCNVPIQNGTVQALATSTPYKPVHKVPTCIEVDKQLESSNNSNDRVVRNVSPAISHSSSTVSTNGMDTQNDNDVPDVRIFVKRRRKVIRK